MTIFFLILFLLIGAPAAAQGSVCEDLEISLEKIGLHFQERDYTAAAEELSTARSLAAQLEASVEIESARLLLEQGRLAEVDDRLAELTRSLPADLPPLVKADLLYVEGSLAYELGQYKKAQNRYEQVLELEKSAESSENLAYTIQLVATAKAGALVGIGDREEKIRVFQAARQELLEIDRLESLLEIDLTLARLRGPEAGRVEVEAMLDRLGEEGYLAIARGFLAWSHAVNGRATLAEEHLEKAIGLAEALEANGEFSVTRHLIADRQLVRWLTRPRDEAIADSMASLEQLDEFWWQGDEGLRTDLLAVWADAYQRLAGQLLRAYSEEGDAELLDLGFQTMERYRARVLASSLRRSGIDQDVLRSFVTKSSAETMAALAEDEAILMFQLALDLDIFGRFAGGSWLMVMTRRGIKVYPLPKDKVVVEAAVGTYVDDVEARRNETTGAANLYKMLLASAVAELPVETRKLILVPDGALHQLPFSSLRASADAETLADRFDLSVVPSVNIWQRWRSTPRPATGSASVIFANSRPEGISATRSLGSQTGLPYAEVEGRRVKRLLGSGSRLLLREEASEAALKSLGTDGFKVLHFATHAVVDAARPERSAIFLAPGDGEDGKLLPAEIAALNLDGAVVVLSACSSARGKYLRGEGVLGLARAFFQAGAQAVLGSLWDLDDQEAKILIEAFYVHLTEGLSSQEALKLAQAELRDAGAPAAAWAGVVVLGDGTLRPVTKRVDWRMLGAISLMLLAFLVLFAFWTKERTAASAPRAG